MLEIGPGHGFFARECLSAKHKYQGVESNRLMCEDLCKKGFSVLYDTAPPLPFEDGSFDLVYAGYLVEFLHDPTTVYQLFCECRRVLKPGGVLAVVSSDFMAMGREFWNVSYMVSIATTQRRLVQCMYDAGIAHLHTDFFAGHLFGPTRYIAYLFNFVYPYRLLSAVTGQSANLNSRIYKLRVSFAEGLLVLGTRDENLLTDARVVM